MKSSIFNSEKKKMIMDRSSNPRPSNVSSSSSTSSIKALGSYLSRMQPTPEVAHQNVVIIMDASTEIDSSALFWPIECLNLKNGDSLTLLRIVHEVDVNPKSGRIYKAEANLNKNMGWVYAKLVIEKEMEMRREECLKNILVELIRRECEYKQIQFDMEVRAGASTKVVALQAAREFKATWIVLDRSIKKDAKYFKENLVCFISKVTRNNKVKILRGNISANAKAGNGLLAEGRTRYSGSDSLMESPDSVVFKSIYEETPAPVEERPEDLFSLEISPAEQITFAKDYYKQRLPLASNINQQADSNQDPLSSAETLYFSDDGSNNGDIVGDTEKVKTVVENFISNLKLPEGSFASSADPCSVCQYKSSLIMGQELIKYTYAELEEATNKFSEENWLSRSGSRPVYKGRLKQGLYIAVKAHKHASYVQLRAQFESEVEGISRAQHKNLVMLLGYCSEDNHRFLVYEYICNGSLYSRLYAGSDRKVLNWQERRKIAIGAARGIRYLHEECRGRQIVHGDLRLKKILLTHNLEPMVGDFGLAYKHPFPQKGDFSNDVYYFGVILLLLITGRKDFDHTLPPRQQHIVQWAQPFIKKYKHVEILDKRIQFPEDYDELYSMIHAATLCLCQNPLERPSMSKVVHILEGDTLDVDETPQIPDHNEPYRKSCSYIRNKKHSWDSNIFDIKEVCEAKSTSTGVATAKFEPLKRKKSENKLRRKQILSYDNMLT